jgi:hypothetical protein
VTFTLTGDEGDCCKCVSGIQPWKHELSLFRNGEEVWCGPIVGGEVDENTGTGRFDAKDLMAWFDRRLVDVPDNDVEFEDADIVEVFNWLLAHGYNKDPFNMSWSFTAAKLGIPITRLYVSYSNPDRWGGNYPYVGNEIRDLSQSGIDFTVVRRSVLCGDIPSTIGTVTRLIDKSWATLPKIKIVGTSMANDVGIGGGAGGYYGYEDDQLWFERPDDGYVEEYGLLQSFDAAPSLDDTDTTALPNPITQRAFALREVRKNPFEYISDGSLSPSAPVEISQLIPGSLIRVDLSQSCRTIESSYMLTELSVTKTADQDESVTVSLSPPGAEGLRG